MLTADLICGPAGPARAPLIALRRFSPLPPRALMIGASTGGPQALGQLLADAPAWLRQIPIVVVLHLPPDFTSVVASYVQRLAKMPARVALNGEKLLPGTVFFSPSGVHLRAMRAGAQVVLVHSDSPPQHFCKPAVDVLFCSAAKAYGPEALGVVLTGMGRDGLAGARAMVEAGGNVIVQDEATSAVWGMPGAIARDGIASAVLPIDGIASAIGGLLVSRRRSAQA